MDYGCKCRCEILKLSRKKKSYDLRVYKDFLTPKVWYIIAEIDKFDCTEIISVSFVKEIKKQGYVKEIKRNKLQGEITCKPHILQWTI